MAQPGITNNDTSQKDIQNNSGYSQYMPGSGFLKNTPDNLGNESLSNATKGSGQASIDAKMSMSNDADKKGLVQNNPGYSQYIPDTGFLKNTPSKNNPITSTTNSSNPK
ncbi:MAG TPA: hypothetical protein VN704_01065 [Verrucomicrobiae bacterium]|nr:hypothetical protein [Verrucomicrobiae bacterium]